MIKKTIALVIVLVAGGAWLYLDCLTRQEKRSAEQLQQGIVQARAEAKMRAGIQAGFEQQNRATLSNCQAAADKSKTDYAALFEQIAPRKRGKVMIPQAVTDAAEKIAASAKADCQQAYDNSLKSGY